MTIKEMSKLYKNIKKSVNDFEEAQETLRGCTVNGDLEMIKEAAKNLSKAASKLEQYRVDCYETFFQNIDLTDENQFIRYMIKKEIEMEKEVG